MDGLKGLVQELQKAEMARANAAKALLGIGNIKKRCEGAGSGISVRVGAVDAGIVLQEFHAFDLIITKAVGVIFEYENGKLKRHEYLPSPLPKEKLHVHGSMDLMELGSYKNIIRLKEEISLALQVAERCDLLLVDGSLVPLPGDKPSSKELRKEYDALLALYRELFSKYENKVVGIIKDSRSKRFLEEYAAHLDSVVLCNSTDTTLLDLVLEKGEMSKVLPYSKDPKSNGVLKDLLPYSERLNCVYIKPGKNDRPVRIEMFGDGSGVLSKVYALCDINDNYSYPSVLIDADLRALIDPRNVERIYKEIEIAPFLKDARALRRNSRPFRG
ncbi:MAG: DNA double-strand break repair nuclease NurA [Candidatus Micrarchaeota archaeon]|nr:DNA double-strand break repair nuclease NurA [Candidatus Micrarchaeota archaeon]